MVAVFFRARLLCKNEGIAAQRSLEKTEIFCFKNARVLPCVGLSLPNLYVPPSLSPLVRPPSPRSDFLVETTPYLLNPEIGILQTPQVLARSFFFLPPLPPKKSISLLARNFRIHTYPSPPCDEYARVSARALCRLLCLTRVVLGGASVSSPWRCVGELAAWFAEAVPSLHSLHLSI